MKSTLLTPLVTLTLALAVIAPLQGQDGPGNQNGPVQLKRIQPDGPDRGDNGDPGTRKPRRVPSGSPGESEPSGLVHVEPRPEPYLNRVPMDLDQVFLRATGHSESRNLVVGSSKLDPAVIGNFDEDLTIMSRILDQVVERTSAHANNRALGIALVNPLGGNSQNLYLEGYGVLFQLNVGFSLLPPASPDEKKPNQPVDSPWEQARRDIYGNRDASREWSSPAPEYDSDKVARLKQELLEALKQAANIRNLKSDDVVAIAVTGSASQRMMFRSLRVNPARVNPSADNGPQRNEPQEPGQPADVSYRTSTRSTRPGTMTLRVKKSDADSLAKGKITFEEFKNRVVVNVY